MLRSLHFRFAKIIMRVICRYKYHKNADYQLHGYMLFGHAVSMSKDFMFKNDLRGEIGRASLNEIAIRLILARE